MATKFPLGRARELHKALGEMHQTLGAALAEIDASGKDAGVNAPLNTPKPSPDLDAQDSDPLGINRLSRARNGSGLTAEMLNRLSHRR